MTKHQFDQYGAAGEYVDAQPQKRMSMVARFGKMFEVTEVCPSFLGTIACGLQTQSFLDHPKLFGKSFGWSAFVIAHLCTFTLCQRLAHGALH